MPEIKTHRSIDRELFGTPVAVEPGWARVELRTRHEMAVDDEGLVHGGFVFGLADHAAMLAVNHPHVVLGAADVRFLEPVQVGERVLADAHAAEGEGKKRQVQVSVYRVREDAVEDVMTGTFTCFVLDHHVLRKEGPA